MADPLELIKGIATVALIAYGIRWLSSAKGPRSPKIHGDVAIYDIKWQIRVVAYASAALCLGLAFFGMHNDLASRGHWIFDLLMLVFGLLGLWFGTGVVTSDQAGITKKFLWLSTSLRWDEITEVWLHKKDGGAIELRGKPGKIVVDMRFVASTYLQNDITERTKLQPQRD